MKNDFREKSFWLGLDPYDPGPPLLTATAYGQFTAGKWLPTRALVAIWTQFVQVAAAPRGRAP